VSRGSTESIKASVTSQNARDVLVDIEVYTPDGRKVFQRFFDNQSFGAGDTQDYSAAWQVPGSAVSTTYTVKIGIFSTGWGTLYSWNDNAAQFVVR